MKIRFLVEEALQALRSNLLRSLLTIIGIVVGIFSVTAMLALGAGLSQNVLNRFNSFAQGDLTISGEITYTDFGQIGLKPYVKHEMATQQVSGASVVAFSNDFSPTVETAIGDYGDIVQYTVTSGSDFDFSSTTYNENVALVSDGFVGAVQTDTNQTVTVGQTITINGIGYKVQGIITSNSNTYTRGDGLILVPYGAALGELTSTPHFSSVAILLKDSSYYEIAGQDMLQTLNVSRDLATDSSDLFTLQTAEAFIQTAQQTTQMISLFLGIVGSIALFVGGIGTMNMMLTTVTERTKEIGLRKAVGARDKDILLQILVESVLLTSLGGALGILLSIGGAYLANKLLAGSTVISVIINLQVVILAACVAFAVGIVFGLYPARRASKLQPVDALRTE